MKAASVFERCTVDGCGRRLFRASLCRTHYRRGPNATIRHWGDKRRAVHEAIMAYADASDDVEAELLWQRLYRACERLFRPTNGTGGPKLPAP